MISTHPSDELNNYISDEELPNVGKAEKRIIFFEKRKRKYVVILRL